MSAFDTDISEEEQRGGFDLGAPDDETFKLEKLDEYPGVMPDFDYEAEPIIPPDEPDSVTSDDDEGLEEFSEEFDELDEIPDIADELGDLLGEDVLVDDDEVDLSEEKIQDEQNDELGVFASDASAEENQDEPEKKEVEEDSSNVIPVDETEDEKALRELLGSEKKRSDEIKADKKAKEPDSKFGFGDDDIEPVQDNFVPVEEQHGDAELIDLSEIAADKPSTFGLETVVVREVDDGIEKPEDEASEEDSSDDKNKKDKKKKKTLSKKRFILFVSSAAVVLLSVIGFAGYQMIYNSDDLIIPGDTLSMEYAKDAGLESQKKLKKKIRKSNNNSEEGDHYKEFEEELDKKINAESYGGEDTEEVVSKKKEIKENTKELSSEKVNLSAENKKRLISQASTSGGETKELAKPEIPTEKFQIDETKDETNKKTKTVTKSKNKKIKRSGQTKDIAKRSTVSHKERSGKSLKYPNLRKKSQSDEGLFAVQIYSSLSEDDARDWLAKLNDKNIKNGFITTQMMRDKIWYRVRFGEFSSRQKAQAAAMQHGFAQSWVDRIK